MQSSRPLPALRNTGLHPVFPMRSGAVPGPAHPRTHDSRDVGGEMTTLTAMVPRHTKDNAEVVVTKMYVTSDHDLLLQGHCAKCLMDVSILIPLANLRDWAPGPMDYGIEDLRFLHSLAVCLPDTPKLLPH